MLNKEKVLNIMESMDLYLDFVTNEGSYNKGDQPFIIFESNDQIEDLINKLNVNDIGDICGLLECDYTYSDEVYWCDYCECYHYNTVNNKINYIALGDYIVCYKDIEDNLEDYLHEFNNNYNIALPEAMEKMTELGYKIYSNNYESGLYGVNDNPKEIYENLSKEYNNIVFYIDSCTPFNIIFGVYVKNDSEE